MMMNSFFIVREKNFVVFFLLFFRLQTNTLTSNIKRIQKSANSNNNIKNQSKLAI